MRAFRLAVLYKLLLGSFLGLVVAFPLLCTAADKETKTVISDGLGADVASAAQNAAQNALINVVGSFMDSNKILEKRVEIQDGVRSQTSSINTNVKEYSQGAIQSFEILKTSQENGLTKVTAKVGVRIEDFQYYIKSLTKGDVEVDGASLFEQSSKYGSELQAQKNIEIKQSSNKAALLYDNAIEPIRSGKAIGFKIHKPRLYWQTELTPNEKKRLNDTATALGEKYGKENILLIEASSFLRQDFLQNMKKTLDSISDEVFNIKISSASTNLFTMQYDVSYRTNNQKNTFVFIVNDSGSEALSYTKEGFEKGKPDIPFNAYIVNDTAKIINSKINESGLVIYTNNSFNLFFEIALIDDSGQILQREISPYDYVDRNPKLRFFRKEDFTKEMMVEWSPFIIPGDNKNVFATLAQRDFFILLAVDPDALRKTKKIQLNLSTKGDKK
ncbi:MAG: hypothetical protein JXO44_15510 [Clostridia bacterium]|nr:hypothetical protein [Clostridia bacterium]